VTSPLFGHDPWWLVLLKAVGVFGFAVVITLFNIFYERRAVARMQHRIGPNRTGPLGSLQSLADGVKLALKEDIIPKAADRVVFIVAPLLSVIPAFMAFAVIPFGPEVSIFGHRTALQLTDLPVGVLYILAVASVGIYGIVLAGWSSGSTYPLLGGLRSTAQLISYEVAMGLSFVAVFLYSGSMSTADIVAAQSRNAHIDVLGAHLAMPTWYAIVLLPSFLIYLVSMVGETNRAPFDLAEAEGELVGGFHTEYSSLKFALFFLAEYINMVTVSSVATTLFLGGWRAPWPLSLWSGANANWWPLLWYLAKVIVLIFGFIWLRGTLPRLRYDQFMRLGWKVLIPASLAWILVVATVRVVSNNAVPRGTVMAYGLGAVAVVLVASLLLDQVAGRRSRTARAVQGGQADDRHTRPSSDTAAGFDAFAGGYPVPPMPGQGGSGRTVPAMTASRTPEDSDA